MGKLTKSMQGLKEAIKRQENQLSDVRKCGGFQEIQVEPYREFKNVYDVLEGKHLAKTSSKLEPFLHSVGSEISQMSHWSCSVDTINASIEDLKHVLKNQDKQVITLITENENIKNQLKKKEKELKKQKFLLKAERETFEQYKKDTFGGLKKQDDAMDLEDIKPDKSARELMKVKSELAHYKQLYTEQRHTMGRLSNVISSLKNDKIIMKEKLLQQEKQYNKFILEMAQRFSVSRKEFQLVTSKKFESLPLAPTNLAVCKIADRNARLAYDNCMLKMELNGLREKFFLKKAENNKLKSLTTRSELCRSKGEVTDPHISNKQDEVMKTGCALKACASEKSGLSVNTNLNLKCAVKTSVTSLIERNSEKVSSWQQVLDKQDHVVETSVLYQNEHNVLASDSFEVMRTESAPQLRVSNYDQL